MFAFSILFPTGLLRPQDAWRQRMGDTRGQERGPEPSKSQDPAAEWGGHHGWTPDSLSKLLQMGGSESGANSLKTS